MADFRYNIRDFTFVVDLKTFFADSTDLWEIGDGRYRYPFPSNRKQFYIQNKKTRDFKRFRWIRDLDLGNNQLAYAFGHDPDDTGQYEYYCIVTIKDIDDE